MNNHQVTWPELLAFVVVILTVVMICLMALK